MLLEDAHALVIGISDYQHVQPLWPTRDAQDVAAALIDPALCGYPPGNVRLLVEAQATRQAILAELEELERRAGEHSTVLVYFSGHGGRAAIEAGHTYFLMPVDCRAGQRSDLEATAISGAELSARLAAIPAAKLTVVLDCCRAAPLAEADLPPPASELPAEAVSPLAKGRGRAVLAASRGDGTAFLPPPGQVHSLFTGCLLRGLRGEAPGAGGVLRICDLFDYVQRHVVELQPAQRPVFKAELEENYPIALLCGGATAIVELPPPPDARPYDVFVTYCDGDEADRRWARRVMIPFLEQRGLRVCFERRDFSPGRSRLEETERAIAESRYTVAVLSPAYLASDFDDYQALLAAHASVEARAPRFIPLLRHPCDLTLHRRMTALLDASRDPQVPAALERLVQALRQPATPRLT